MTPDSPPLAPADGTPGPPPPAVRRSRTTTVLAACVAALVLVVVAVLWLGSPLDGPSPSPTDTGSPTATERSPTATSSSDQAAARTAAVEALLAERSQAVLAQDGTAWQALVDPSATAFAEAQATLIDRLAAVPFAEWAYEVVGDGPPLTTERAQTLPAGSAIIRVRLTYRIEGTETRTNREQYLTVVPRDGDWLLAGDADAGPSGVDTQRDLWDLGPVRVVRGERSTVIADRRGASQQRGERLAREADSAVENVDEVWRSDWSRRPIIVLPRSQQDMATLIGDDGDGLAQIAAVTTGVFERGIARGDRVVVNPDAFDTLGALGRTVVLTHEMTHVATRATSVVGPPIWLSEGFADYVAYEATPVPTAIVASDVLGDVRDGEGPRRLPEQADFDAGEGDIAAAYEGAWLACKMIAERYGEKALLRLYLEMSDDSGEGWPEETSAVLGITAKELTRDWRAYLRDLAAA